MHTVAAVVDQGALTFDFAIPCEVFGIDRSDLASPWYEFLVVAAGKRRVRTQTGFTIEAPHGLAALERADTIVVPGWTSPEVEPGAKLLAALRRAHRRNARIVSICTGAFVLAAAGLLDGRRAVTHWMYTDELRRRHPRVDVDPSVLYVVDGTIMTSAGTAAGIDLCLHIVTCDYGADIAASVARRLLMPLYRSGGQAQYVDVPVSKARGDEMSELLAWALPLIPTRLSVDDLARRASVSRRTLTRRFRQATGLAPGEWLQRERLRLARRLLETSEDPIERVAHRAGYETTVSMRAHFARDLHTSPRAYRRTFRMT
jgi:transcriptional regulator GlxA family with amidase domain